MDPQSGGGHQTGGFDPGLAALIAALLSGGVGGYGYFKDERTADQKLEDAAKALCAKDIAEAKTAKSQGAVTTQRLESAKTRVEDLEKEVESLKSENQDLREKVASAASMAGPALTFQDASSGDLKDAIPKVLAALQTQFPHLVSNEKNRAAIEKVLLYPTLYQAKLSRLTLPMFYSKQVEPLFRQIVASPVTGGRRRYRRARGGVDNPMFKSKAAFLERGRFRNAVTGTDGWADALRAPDEAEIAEANAEAAEARENAEAARKAARKAASETSARTAAIETASRAESMAELASSIGKRVPSYEQFATIYDEAIRGSKMKEATRIDTESRNKRKEIDDKVQQKKNRTAVTAARALLRKFEPAIQSAQAALDAAVSADQEETLRPAKQALRDKLDRAREVVGNTADMAELPPTKRFGLFGGAAGTLAEIETEDDWTQLNTPVKVEKILGELQEATKAYEKGVKTANKDAAKAAATASKDAAKAAATANTSIHDDILKTMPVTIAKTETNAKKIDTTIKNIENALKLVPRPEIFSGGCFIATIAARQTLDVLGGAYSKLSGHLSELKDAFKTYKTETDGIKAVLNSSFEYTPAEISAMEAERAAKEAATAAEQAQKKVEQDARIKDAQVKIEVWKKALKQKRRLIAAWDDLKARGIPPPPPPGAVFPGLPLPPPPPPAADGSAGLQGGGLVVLRKLKQRMDDAIVGIRKEMIPVAGLVVDGQTLLAALKSLPKQETLSPEDQAQEAQFCKKIAEEDVAGESASLTALPADVGTGPKVTMMANPMLQGTPPPTEIELPEIRRSGVSGSTTDPNTPVSNGTTTGNASPRSGEGEAAVAGPEALAAGLPPSSAYGPGSRPGAPALGQSMRNLVSPPSTMKGGKKSRRKGRKARKSTLKKRRGGK